MKSVGWHVNDRAWVIPNLRGHMLQFLQGCPLGTVIFLLGFFLQVSLKILDDEIIAWTDAPLEDIGFPLKDENVGHDQGCNLVQGSEIGYVAENKRKGY